MQMQTTKTEIYTEEDISQGWSNYVQCSSLGDLNKCFQDVNFS